jgi:hypothetical protein
MLVTLHKINNNNFILKFFIMKLLLLNVSSIKFLSILLLSIYFQMLIKILSGYNINKRKTHICSYFCSNSSNSIYFFTVNKYMFYKEYKSVSLFLRCLNIVQVKKEIRTK